VTYEDLDVYQAGLDLAEKVYRVTQRFPREELYGLTAQMRKCAVSVSSNIAEGWGRGKGAANANFVRISRGSVYELATQANLALRLGFVPEVDVLELKTLLDRVGRLVQAYLAVVEAQVVREEVAEYRVTIPQD